MYAPIDVFKSVFAVFLCFCNKNSKYKKK